jgi:ADP-heptose:LPS heptosyltransferase
VAVISLLDVVVTVDTAVAHLAGALGKRVLILLPHAADFRWMRVSDTTPWYPTARLLRQPAFGDWDSVMVRLADELRAMAG